MPGDVTIESKAVQAAPFSYEVPGAQDIVLKCATASFDGTLAAGSFVPTLQIVAPDGFVVGSFPANSSLAAGATADVSWFPGPMIGASSGSGGTGLYWGSNIDSTDLGLLLQALGAIGVTIQSNGGAGVTLTSSDAGGVNFNANSGGGITATDDSTGLLSLVANNDDGLFLESNATATHSAAGETASLLIVNTGSDATHGNIVLHDAGSGSQGMKIINNSPGPLVVNSTGHDGAVVQAAGELDLAIGGTGQPVGTTGINILDNAGNGIYFVTPNGVFFGTAATPAGSCYIQAFFDDAAGNDLVLTGLPTVNPGGSGIVWRNGNVLNIT